MGERKTEDLKVTGSIPVRGKLFFVSNIKYRIIHITIRMLRIILFLYSCPLVFPFLPFHSHLSRFLKIFTPYYRYDDNPSTSTSTNGWYSRATKNQARYANPVTQEGSNYGKYTNEEDAFLWFDEALFYVRAGSGGAGSSAFKFGKGRQHRYPTGGSGGTGGNVYLVADANVNTLLGFRGQSHFRAENGIDGDQNYANGKSGKALYVSVPKGLVVRDNETNAILGELNYPGDQLLVAKGGLGGKGNAAFKSGIEKAIASPPQGGERRWLKIELKLVADVGLVGLPNASKSTFLDAVTNARPKIASYAFTTIVPNLGVCEIFKGTSGSIHSGSGSGSRSRSGSGSEDGDANVSEGESGRTGGGEEAHVSYDRMVIADIPGLIEGAHEGRGLGRGFLRHVERCKILIHLVDGTSKDPVKDFLAINNELQMFSPILAQKPQIVVLNKIDVPEVQEKADSILREISQKMPHKRLLSISAAGRIGTEELIQRTYSFLEKIRRDEQQSQEQERAQRRGAIAQADEFLPVLLEEDDDVDVAAAEMNKGTIAR